MIEEQKNDIDETIVDETAEKKTEEKSESQVMMEKIESLQNMVHKGYTSQAQEISELRNNLSSIAEGMNSKSGATEGDDDYVTVSKLKSILQEVASEKASAQEKLSNDASKYVDNALNDLRMQGIISNDVEQKELIQLALKKSEELKRNIDPYEAAAFYKEIKLARATVSKEKEIAQKKAKQEEGSKIGSSSKNSSESVGKISWNEILRERW